MTFSEITFLFDFDDLENGKNNLVLENRFLVNKTQSENVVMNEKNNKEASYLE
jgi:hypothetical protein